MSVDQHIKEVKETMNNNLMESRSISNKLDHTLKRHQSVLEILSIRQVQIESEHRAFREEVKERLSNMKP